MAVLLLLTGVIAGAGGCASDHAQTMKEAYAAYERADYPAAYRGARVVAAGAQGAKADEAAYLAGLAALRLREMAYAEHYLNRATQSANRGLAADAKAQLGLVYTETRRYDLAARSLEEAAPDLSGQHRANAYYYAALAQQKMGSWIRARENLALARRHSEDAAFKRSCDDLAGVIGYTIQTGAFAAQANAQRAAQELSARANRLGLGPPRIVPGADSQGRPLHLVQVGQFSTFDSASAARERLEQSGALVVPLRQR